MIASQYTRMGKTWGLRNCPMGNAQPPNRDKPKKQGACLDKQEL
jgi:hypothetical protein